MTLEEADPVFKHEDISFEILAETNSLVQLVERNEKEGGWGLPIGRVISILKAKPSTIEGTLKDRILHSLIDGPIDADKVDYLLRDSIRLGLNYGRGMDLERLLRTLTIVFREQSGATYAALGTHEKGKVPAEAVAFARYAMFGNVYWHHAYRSIKAMIHRIVWEAIVRTYDPEDEEGKRQFRTELKAFIRNQDLRKDQQPALFLIDQPEEFVCQIQYGDLAMINWIAKRAKDIGSTFVELLAGRRLFKRVLVLSSERTEDRALWARLSAFYGTHKRNGQMKVRLQEKFQTEVKEAVMTQPRNEWPQLASVTEEAYEKFISAAEAQVILLIDLPADRPGSESPLEFIIEEDRRRVKIDEMRTGNRETSIVWKVLQESFQQSIGKLRVFCHPDVPTTQCSLFLVLKAK